MNVLSVHIEAWKRGVELAAQMLAKKSDVKIVFKGQECKTDGKNIYLPEVSLLARKNMNKKEVEEAESFLAALRGYLDHEVGHILFSDMDAFKGALRKGGPKLMATTNALEDPRIERKMAELWAGAGFNLKTTAKYVFDHYDDPKSLRPLQQIIAGWTMLARGFSDHPTYKALDAKARRFLESKRVRALIEESLEARGTDEVVDCAARLLDMLKEEAKAEEKQQDGQGKQKQGKGQKSGKGQKGKSKGKPSKAAGGDDEDEEPVSPSLGDLDEEEEEEDESESGNGSGNEESEEDEDGEDDGASGSEGDDEGEEEEAGSGTGTGEDDAEEDFDAGSEPGDGSGGARGGSSGLEEDLQGGDSAFEKLLDGINDASVLKKGIPPPDGSESDEYTIYTTEDDHVAPPEVYDVERSRTDYNRLLSEVGANTLGVIQRGLRNYLKARSYSYKVRDLEEGKVDRRRLYRLATGMSRNIFQQEVERLDLENVACSLWINESGSMGGVARLAVQVCCAFAETLDALDVPFEVCGHTTGAPDADVHMQDAALPDGTTPYFTRYGTLHVDVFKAFSEQWRSVRHRLVHYQALANTYDAEAVKLATRRIREVSQRRKVIFMLDDGAPNPNWGDDHDKHRDYLKEIVPEILKTGVEIIAVGIHTDAVQEYYPKSVVINDMSMLGPTVLNELRGVLTRKGGTH